MFWGITCSCFSLEQNLVAKMGKRGLQAHGARGGFWEVCLTARGFFLRGPYSFPSRFCMGMWWELNDVWDNIGPGHEMFNSHFAFLKEVPPLTDQKEKETCGSMMPVDPCLTVAPCPHLFHRAVGTSQVHLFSALLHRVKAQAVFHCCSQVLPLTTVCTGAYPNL